MIDEELQDEIRESDPDAMPQRDSTLVVPNDAFESPENIP
jgi:hypothetical protein